MKKVRKVGEVGMITDNIRNLKRHLKSQIAEADKVNSEWVYILKVEAEKCLELAEAEDTIIEILSERGEQNASR